MNNDLISRSKLEKAIKDKYSYASATGFLLTMKNVLPQDVVYQILTIIDNAPTIEPFERIGSICEENCGYRPQGECKNCKHFKESLCENSPNGWCSIRRVTQEGDLETQVPKDYYCSWFEKGGVEE